MRVMLNKGGYEDIAPTILSHYMKDGSKNFLEYMSAHGAPSVIVVYENTCK